VFRKEHERRWNTPPELTPGSVKRSSEEETRLLSLVSFPVTASIGLNSGNSAHSVSLAASLDGVSLSESNSYDYPVGYRAEGYVWNNAVRLEIPFAIRREKIAKGHPNPSLALI